ncbi:MAG: hypothetical protein VW405_20275 [Rhodospirillaceae bacterium]
MPDTPNPPDLDELTRRYMDLWQDHLNAVAGDVETADVLARTLALMNSGAQAFAAAAQAAAQGPGGDAAAGTPAGSAPAAAFDGGADADLAGFAERLAALEERVAQLESKPWPRRRKPDPGD